MVTQTGRAWGRAGRPNEATVAADAPAGHPVVQAAAAAPEGGAGERAGAGEQGVGEEFAGQPGGPGGHVGPGVAAQFAGRGGEGGCGVAAQEARGEAVTGAQGGGERFQMAVQHHVREGRRVAGQRPDLGQPQVVGGAPLGVPAHRLRGEVGDGAVQRGAAEGRGPQAGGQALMRHGGGDPRLGGAQGGPDPAHPHGQGVGQEIGQGSP